MSRLRWALFRHFFEFGALFYISSTLEFFRDFWAELSIISLFGQHLSTLFFTIFHVFNSIFCLRNVFSKPHRVILLSWIWIIQPCPLNVVMKMHNYPFKRGNSRFWKKKNIGVSLVVWSPNGKSRVKALIKLEYLWTSAGEIIKNYEQLSSTISKFQTLVQNWKFKLCLSTFFAIFWARLLGEFSSAIGTCYACENYRKNLFWLDYSLMKRLWYLFYNYTTSAEAWVFSTELN